MIYDTDYKGDDGLFRCAICHEPKEFFIGKNKYPSQCECERKVLAKKELASNRRVIEERRKEFLPNAMLRTYTFASDDGRTPNLTKVIKAYADEFIDQGNEWLLLFGSVDTGKSFYAMCIANELIDNGHTVAYTTPRELIVQAQDFTQSAYLEKILRADAVFLDDLGTERDTAFGYEQLFALVDGCYTCNIPIIITTNYTLREMIRFAENTGDLSRARIYSRILDKVEPVLINDIHRREERYISKINAATTIKK